MQSSLKIDTVQLPLPSTLYSSIIHSSRNKEEALKEVTEQLNAIGFDSLGQYMAEFQQNVRKMVTLQRDGAKMAGVLKTCSKCRSVGGKKMHRLFSCMVLWS